MDIHEYVRNIDDVVSCWRNISSRMAQRVFEDVIVLLGHVKGSEIS